MSTRTFCFVSAWEKTYGGNDGDGGIYVFEMSEDGSLELMDRVNEELAIGYITVTSDGKHLYGLNETKNFSNTDMCGGSVLSYDVDMETGKLKFINTTPTVGTYPCYVTLTKDETHLLVTNHGSIDWVAHSVQNEDGSYELVRTFEEGSVAMFPIQADGSVDKASYLAVHNESGGDPVRQASGHPHSINVDPQGTFALVCDRGGDRIYSYRIDNAGSKLIPCCEIRTREGAGPRHLVFHPDKDLFFVVCELQAFITAYSYNRENGMMTEINTISVEPENYQPKDSSNFRACTHPADTHIHPNGKFVYSSNRGHNSITTFAIDDENGALIYVTNTSTCGLSPRSFGIDPSGKYMLVANQDSNTINTFELNPDGSLTPTGSVTYANQPVCIKFTKI